MILELIFEFHSFKVFEKDVAAEKKIRKTKAVKAVKQLSTFNNTNYLEFVRGCLYRCRASPLFGMSVTGVINFQVISSYEFTKIIQTLESIGI